MKYQIENLQKSIRRWLIFFMACLIISGLTAVDVENGIWWLSSLIGPGSVHNFISKVLSAVREVGMRYNFLFYGYDWLAFAHLVIAVAFVGPYQDPVRNKWVVQFGRFAALMVIPFALVAGSFRGIPFWWQMVDCSFGIVALWPLSKCYWLIKKLEVLQEAAKEVPAGKCKYQMMFK